MLSAYATILCLVGLGLTEPVVEVLDEDDEGREVLLPFVTLSQPAEMPKLEVVELSEQRIDEIEGLIDKLRELKSPDVNLLNNPVFNTVFLPVGEFETFGPRLNKPVESFAPLKQLVEIGPEALPYLLESLDSKAETRLVVLPEPGFRLGLAFDEVLQGNPVIPIERRALGLDRELYTQSTFEEPGIVPREMESYRVKVGDVCLAIIGQIVSRDYRSLSYAHPKDLSIIVCSPVHRKSVREKIRKIWQTKNPRQKVLESLILDFYSRGVYQGESLDRWDIGNNIQIEAVMRLLYYYPVESMEIIEDRIASFPCTDNDVDDWLEAGVRIPNFIDAVSWFKHDTIQRSLVELAGRAKDDELIEALKRAGIETPGK